MNQKHYQRLIDNLNTAVLLVDQDLRVEYMNNAAQNLLAISGNRGHGQALEEIFSDEDSCHHELIQSLASGQPYTKREASLLLHNSSALIADYTVTPIAGEDTFLVVEIFSRDRWLRISREEHLMEQQQVSKNLIRGLAHEIKNPLGGIRGAAQLLARELDSAQLADYTDIIIAESDRLTTLVDQMLGPHKPIPHSRLNIHEALERVRSLIETEAAGAVTLVRDYDPSIPDIEGSLEQLIQALLNIVRNAMQAITQSDSKVKGEIKLVSRTQRQITLGPKRHRIVCRIDIIDNGPGIPAHLQDTIFYPMVSTSDNGTGLGLTLAQQIIGQHGGLIEHHSQPGNTCFSIFIPIDSCQ